jgi:hypothetical protein
LADHYRHHSKLEPEGESESAGDESSGDRDQQEELLAVAQALGQLSEDYREVIRLRVVLELPTETVASWMSRSPGAVRVLLHRALKELNRNLDKDGALDGRRDSGPLPPADPNPRALARGVPAGVSRPGGGAASAIGCGRSSSSEFGPCHSD